MVVIDVGVGLVTSNDPVTLVLLQSGRQLYGC